MPSTSATPVGGDKTDPSHVPITVAGCVTEQPSGLPLPQVVVTDGYSLTRTDAHGRYQLPIHKAARWVTAINPPGYQPDGSQYVLLDDAAADRAMAFAFTPLSTRPDEPFCFVQISDSHMANPYWAERYASEVIDTINHLADKPAFVMDCGDLSINSPEQLQAASRAIQHCRVPYLTAIGNHDRPRMDTYERLFGPIYRAYTYHDWLVVVLPWQEDMQPAFQWTRQLLQDAGHRGRVLVQLHHFEGLRTHLDQFMSLFASHGAQAIFMGHYHTNQVSLHQGMPAYVVRGAVMRNNDVAGPGFNLVQVAGQGLLEVTHRRLHQRQSVRVVQPEPERLLSRGAVQDLLLQVEDTTSRVSQVEMAFYDSGVAGTCLARVELMPDNDLLWRGQLRVQADWPDETLGMIRVTDVTGRSWAPMHQICRVVDQARPDADAAPGRAPCSPVRLAWVHAVQGCFGFSRPVLHDNVLYAGVEQVRGWHESAEAMVAVRADGSRRWTCRLQGQSVRTTPLVAGDLVVAQADDGCVLAWSRQDGQRRWTNQQMRSAAGAIQVYYRSSPQPIGLSDAIVGVGHLYARLSLQDGTSRWHPQVIDGHRLYAPPSPAVDGEQVYAAAPNRLLALAGDTGQVCWEAAVAGLAGPATVAHGVIYTVGRMVGDKQPGFFAHDRWSNSVMALDGQTGQARWTTPLRQVGFNSARPVVWQESLLAIDGASVVCLDRLTGEVRWRVSFARCIGAADWQLSRESPHSGLYTFCRDGLVLGDPVVWEDRLYLVTRMGTVLAVDLQTQQVAWHYPLHAEVLAGPTVADGRIYVGAGDGGLYALDESR